MDSELKKATCECGSEFEYEPIIFDGVERFMRRACSGCMEKAQREFERQDTEKKLRHRGIEWSQICPPLYLATNLDDARLSRAAVQSVLGWDDNGDGVGLALRGESGKGKTRLAFMLCRRLFFSGKSVAFMPATKLAQLCIDSFDDEHSIKNAARERLRSAKRVQYLLLDDLGKQKFTERAEMELYDVIETRTSNLLPIIWTANATSDDFAAMMSPDRGAPIIRRLAEFSTIIAL